MPCKAPAFLRKPDCPGPAGQPANKRCGRCARGLCEAPGEKFNPDCAGPDGNPPLVVCPVCRRKKQLSQRRGSISNLMQQPATTGQQLQRAWTDRVGMIVQELFDEALRGAAPCRYAFCMAGSGARHEASPYSDLDCFILVEDESPASVTYFRDTCERMRDVLGAVEGNVGLRFCNIMSPFGSPGNPRAPELIRTPHNMAELVEWAPDRIEGHISGGLQEHRFLFGTQGLYDDFKTDLNVVLAETCYSFSSRPIITRRKKMGLKVIKELVNDRRFTPPARTDEFFHVKEQFYRPPQFIAKGLAWYYGIDAVSTSDQLTQLVAGNHMTQAVANNFRAVMNAMAKLRFKLHLDREGEKDFVYTNQGARDAELVPLEAKGAGGRTEEEKERYNRLKGGTHLTRAEVKELTDVISNLNYIMKLARAFVREKEKLLGKRNNPFANP
jgi:hypothetical protein